MRTNVRVVDPPQRYRAEIIDVDGSSKVRVRFVDYGNEDLIAEPQTCLKQMDEIFLRTPAQSILCYLQGKGRYAFPRNRGKQ